MYHFTESIIYVFVIIKGGFINSINVGKNGDMSGKCEIEENVQICTLRILAREGRTHV